MQETSEDLGSSNCINSINGAVQNDGAAPNGAVQNDGGSPNANVLQIGNVASVSVSDKQQNDGGAPNADVLQIGNISSVSDEQCVQIADVKSLSDEQRNKLIISLLKIDSVASPLSEKQRRQIPNVASLSDEQRKKLIRSLQNCKDYLVRKGLPKTEEQIQSKNKSREIYNAKRKAQRERIRNSVALPNCYIEASDPELPLMASISEKVAFPNSVSKVVD